MKFLSALHELRISSHTYRTTLISRTQGSDNRYKLRIEPTLCVYGFRFPVTKSSSYVLNIFARPTFWSDRRSGWLIMYCSCVMCFIVWCELLTTRLTCFEYSSSVCISPTFKCLLWFLQWAGIAWTVRGSNPGGADFPRACRLAPGSTQPPVWVSSLFPGCWSTMPLVLRWRLEYSCTCTFPLSLRGFL
jgi:hypothetical protein